MSLGLSQEMSQRQILSLHMRQNLSLLEAPIQELAQTIRAQASLNPVLEISEPDEVSIDAERERWQEEEAGSSEDHAADADPDARTERDGVPAEATENAGLSQLDSETLDYLYSDGGNNEYDPDAEERRQFMFDSIPARESLEAHLAAQVSQLPIPAADLPVVEAILGSLDGDGFLRTPLAEIAQGLFLDLERCQQVLSVLQTSLSPVGVCARDLRECLLLQMKAEPERFSKTAFSLVEDPDSFAMLEKRLFDKIAERLGVTRRDVVTAVGEIATLDPSPCSNFQEKAQAVYPEIIVTQIDGKWTARLDETRLPKIWVSPFYRRRFEKLAEESSKRPRAKKGTTDPVREEKRYLNDRIGEAEQLMRGIGERQATILRVAQAVVDKQAAFFEEGRTALRPLTMREIAAELGVNESTVSRAVNGKYLRSPRGVSELRSFFIGGVAGADGAAFSSDGIRDRLKKMIENEDPAKPLSDSEISKRFQAEGVTLARRTVAKYRDALGIPPVASRGLA